MVVLSVGAYFVADLGKLKETIAARERQDLAAMVAKAANETSTAIEKLSNEVEPRTLSGDLNLGVASRSDLEALRSNLKTAEANANTFMPRYITLLKAERDKVETYAHSMRTDKDTVSKVLDGVDRRHAKTADFTSKLLLARADYYRAYETYIAVLVSNFGAYKVINGEFIFQLQSIVDRYNFAAHAMTVAAKRVAELEEERKALFAPQPDKEYFGRDK